MKVKYDITKAYVLAIRPEDVVDASGGFKIFRDDKKVKLYLVADMYGYVYNSIYKQRIFKTRQEARFEKRRSRQKKEFIYQVEVNFKTKKIVKWIKKTS